jgi:hypothetical protein
MEWFWAIFGISGLLLVLWVIAAGDRSDAMTDEVSTLDVANHIGDTRPVR